MDGPFARYALGYYPPLILKQAITFLSMLKQDMMSVSQGIPLGHTRGWWRLLGWKQLNKR